MTKVDYSYWVDRKVGEWIYRFSDYAITRCRATDFARHFKVYMDFETKESTTTAWRYICNKAAAENVDATPSSRSVPQASSLPVTLPMPTPKGRI